VKAHSAMCTYSKKQRTEKIKGSENKTESKNDCTRTNETTAPRSERGLKTDNIDDEGFKCSKFGIAKPSSQEMRCIQALYELKTANLTAQPLENSRNDSNVHCSFSIPYSIPENILVGTKTNVFLFTFVQRTEKTLRSIVDLELVQMAVGALSFNGPANTNPPKCPKMLRERQQLQQQKVDPACWAYFLAAIRLGSLQSDDFEIGMQEEYYRAMDFSLQKSHTDERKEVILAHLLVAFFCFATSQTQYFIKHCGFAKNLLDCIRFNVPHYLKNAFFVVVYGSKQLLAPPYVVENSFLNIVFRHFEVCPNSFRNEYPHFTKHMHSISESNTNLDASLDAEFGPTLLAIFEGTPTVATLLIMVRFFQQALLRSSLTKQQILEALIEMKEIIKFVLKAAKLVMDSESTFLKSYILQIECFKCLLCADFQSAKYLLAKVLDSTDFWMVRIAYFTYGEVLVHQIHILIAAATILGMDCEYHCFWLQLKKACSLTHRQFSVPWSIQDIYNLKFCSLCNCEERNVECSVPLTALSRLWATDESVTKHNCQSKSSDTEQWSVG